MCTSGLITSQTTTNSNQRDINITMHPYQGLLYAEGLVAKKVRADTPRSKYGYVTPNTVVFRACASALTGLGYQSFYTQWSLVLDPSHLPFL